MCYMKKVMAMLLVLAMVLTASFAAFAADSPVVAPTEAPAGLDENTQDHINKTVDTQVTDTAAVVQKVESTEGYPNVNFRIARDANNNAVAITKVGNGVDGIFDSDAGRIITKTRVKSTAKVTIAKNAYKGSKVKTVELWSKKKLTIKKNAFNGTKVKSAKIMIRGSKRKASAFKFEKGAFNGLNSSAKVVVEKGSMSKTEFAKLKKALRAAGFKGKITRV